MSDADALAYLERYQIAAHLKTAVLEVMRARPSNPHAAIGEILLRRAAANTPTTRTEEEAANKIAGYLKCMNSKLKTAGRGEQNAEMMLVHRTDGKLVVEDFGGWAGRNASMQRMLQEMDAAGMLPDFAPVLIQTGDRCIARFTGNDDVELHLWQNQPVTDELRARLPLRRVLSMCSTPKYADVPIPDWCFDAWPEGGVPEGRYNSACAEIAKAGAAAPIDGAVLSWCGTAHHHPSRLKLVDMAKAYPERMACIDVVDKAIDKSRHRSLVEQVTRCRYLLDIQGKGELYLHARPFHRGSVSPSRAGTTMIQHATHVVLCHP